MRIFWRTAALFSRYWPRAIVSYICLFAEAGLTLLVPRLTGQAIDTALGSGSTQTLTYIALGIAAAGLGRSLLDYWQSYLSEYLSQKVALDLRTRFYNRLQKLSYAFHDRSQTGQLMSRATVDIEAVRMFVSFAMLRGAFFIIQLVAIGVLLFTIDWKLALISLSIVPVVSWRTIVVNSRLRELWTKIQNGLGILETIVQENLAGVRVVRAFAREEHENKKFRKQAEAIYDMEIQTNNLLAVNSPVMSFAVMLAMAGILWYGGREVIAGTLTTGELAQFLLYLVMFSMPVRALGWLVTLFSRAIASGKRVFEVIDQVSPVTEKPDATGLSGVNGLVKFENVSFGYETHGTVLKGIDFEAVPGQIIALVGASGSGKSTIANLIPRFYDVTEGRVTIDGIDIRDVTLASLRKHVGIVHQDTFLFSATVRENISYGKPDASLEEIMNAARTARLHDFIMGLPQGYDTWVGERGITLSGGQKQRLAIARTLLLNPRILIMDDSTSSVDMETEYLIQQALAELPAGRTTFIIAHRLRSVQIADLILVLKDGQIIERGKHDELLAKGGLYRQLYNIQFQDQESAAAVIPTAEYGSPDASPLSAIKTGEEAIPVSRERLSGVLPDSDDVVFGKPYDSGVVTRMAKYFAPFKVALPLTITATLFYTLSNVASPYIIGQAENNYITTGNVSGLSFIVLLFIANGILNGISYYAQIRAEARLGQAILLKLRTQLFDHLQRLSARFFDRNEAGRIMSRIHSDVGELGDFLDSGAFWVLGEVAGLISIIVTMTALDWKLALITLSVVPGLFIYLAFWQSRARHYFIQVRQAISAVNAALQENISGIRVIQSLSREELNSQHFDSVNQANFEANIKSARLSASMMPAVEVLVAAATTLIILFGGGRIFAGTLMVGTLITFVLYIQTFFDPIRTMTAEYAQLQRAMASGSRVFELIDVKPELTESTKHIEITTLNGEIKFENVSFAYQTGINVLHDIDLQISPGQTVALVGPTGAGKSTVVSLIARFYDVTGGRILIDGLDLREIEQRTYRRHLGLVLQDPFLFSTTIKENIRYGNPEAGDAEIKKAAAAVGAHDFISKLENAYDTVLEERGQNLSMGQRQLISFARALLANPVILLLDEATANIDSYSEHVLQEGLKELTKDRTTVVIAHRLSTVRDADLIIVLDKGKIVEQGRHDDLIHENGLYKRLYEMTYARVGRN